MEINFLYGAKSKSDILYLDYLNQISSHVGVCTEDGNVGDKMFATDLLERFLEDTNI